MPPIGLGLVMLVVWLTYGPKSKLAQSARRKTLAHAAQVRAVEQTGKNFREYVSAALNLIVLQTETPADRRHRQHLDEIQGKQEVLDLEAFRKN